MLAPIHFTCTICPSLASTYIYTCMLLCQPSSHNVRSTKPLLPTLHASASRSVAQHTPCMHTQNRQQASSVCHSMGKDAYAASELSFHARHVHATSVETR